MITIFVCRGCRARWLAAGLRPAKVEGGELICAQCGGEAAPEHRNCVRPKAPSMPMATVVPPAPQTFSGRGQSGEWGRVLTKSGEQRAAATVRPGKKS
jgi:hypothetical protein